MFFAAAHPNLHRNVYAPAGRTLERFLDQTRTGVGSTPTRYSQDENSFTLSLDMPGISKEQLGVSIDGAVVRLQTREGAARQYRAAYELPLEIDSSLSEARLENGVLTLKLAKKAPVSTAAELTIQ